MINQVLLKELFTYNPDTGILSWKVRPCRNINVGSEAGGISLGGYRTVSVNKSRQYVHRVIWCLVYGELPKYGIDHINGVRDDNRLINLRAANQSENMQNIRAPLKNNSTGYLGVTFYKPDGTYQAQITINNKYHYLGRYPTAIEAHEVYLAAKKELHPFSEYTS